MCLGVVCVCVCVCLCVYMCVYIYTYIHTYWFTDAFWVFHACVSVACVTYHECIHNQQIFYILMLYVCMYVWTQISPGSADGRGILSSTWRSSFTTREVKESNNINSADNTITVMVSLTVRHHAFIRAYTLMNGCSSMHFLCVIDLYTRNDKVFSHKYTTRAIACAKLGHCRRVKAYYIRPAG